MEDREEEIDLGLPFPEEQPANDLNFELALDKYMQKVSAKKAPNTYRSEIESETTST